MDSVKVRETARDPTFNIDEMSASDWGTPISGRNGQPMAAVTPTMALSTGPLSPEVENESGNDDEFTTNVEIVKLRCQLEQLTGI